RREGYPPRAVCRCARLRSGSRLLVPVPFLVLLWKNEAERAVLYPPRKFRGRCRKLQSRSRRRRFLCAWRRAIRAFASPPSPPRHCRSNSRPRGAATRDRPSREGGMPQGPFARLFLRAFRGTARGRSKRWHSRLRAPGAPKGSARTARIHSRVIRAFAPRVLSDRRIRPLAFLARSAPARQPSRRMYALNAATAAVRKVEWGSADS